MTAANVATPEGNSTKGQRGLLGGLGAFAGGLLGVLVLSGVGAAQGRALTPG